MESNNKTIPKDFGELRHLTKQRPKKAGTKNPQLHKTLKKFQKQQPDMYKLIGQFALWNTVRNKIRGEVNNRNRNNNKANKQTHRLVEKGIYAPDDPTRPNYNWLDDIVIPRLKAYYRDRDLTESKGVYDDDNPANWSAHDVAQANKHITLARKVTKPFKKPPGPRNRRLPSRKARKKSS
jgi:hypothetical protein